VAALSTFASDLLEEAKRFLEMADEASKAKSGGENAFLHASLLLGFAAFEAHVNAIAFLARPDLNPHERGLLAEHAVELKDGEFQESSMLKIQRLEDRLLFLCRRFSNTAIDRAAPYWSEFMDAANLRNRLTHPKAEPPAIKEKAVRRAFIAIIDLLNFAHTSIYKKSCRHTIAVSLRSLTSNGNRVGSRGSSRLDELAAHRSATIRWPAKL
jgi:hypothetical protein